MEVFYAHQKQKQHHSYTYKLVGTNNHSEYLLQVVFLSWMNEMEEKFNSICESI